MVHSFLELRDKAVDGLLNELPESVCRALDGCDTASSRDDALHSLVEKCIDERNAELLSDLCLGAASLNMSDLKEKDINAMKVAIKCSRNRMKEEEFLTELLKK